MLSPTSPATPLPGSCSRVALVLRIDQCSPPILCLSHSPELSSRSGEGWTKNTFTSGRLQIHFVNLVLEVRTHPGGGSVKTSSTFLEDSSRQATSLAAWPQAIGLLTLNAVILVYVALTIFSPPSPRIPDNSAVIICSEESNIGVRTRAFGADVLISKPTVSL